MGAFRVTIEIGDKEGQRFEQIDAFVDTGATYTWIPASVLRRLGHAPEEQRQFVLADGRDITYGLAWLPVRFDGRSTQPRLRSVMKAQSRCWEL